MTPRCGVAIRNVNWLEATIALAGEAQATGAVMGWSLNYQPPKEPELLEEFFLTVGKALYLACAFEGKCRWVLRIAKLADHYQQTGDASATMALARAMKDKVLGPTLNELKDFPDFDLNEIAVLERAKDARNFIAHECADIGSLSGMSAQRIQEQLARLRSELRTLAAGDNLVSRWVYEIEEKEPAPRGIQQMYPEWIEQWVFSGSGRT